MRSSVSSAFAIEKRNLQLRLQQTAATLSQLGVETAVAAEEFA